MIYSQEYKVLEKISDLHDIYLFGTMMMFFFPAAGFE